MAEGAPEGEEEAGEVVGVEEAEAEEGAAAVLAELPQEPNSSSPNRPERSKKRGTSPLISSGRV